MDVAIKNGHYVNARGFLASTPLSVVKATFSRCGRVLGLMKESKTSDKVTVCFENQQAAQAAVARLNQVTVVGKKVTVSLGSDARGNGTSVKSPVAIKQPSATNASPSHDKVANYKPYRVCQTLLKTGNCPRGDSCRDYHGPDLSKVKNQKAQDGSDRGTEILNKSSKIQVCRKLISGGCDLGDKCEYLHPASLTKNKSKNTKNTPKPEKKTKSPKAPKEKAIDQAVKCGECESKDAQVNCTDCKIGYCKPCNGKVHQSRVMSKHSRTPLATASNKAMCQECNKKMANVKCFNCDAVMCNQCSWKIHAFKVLRGHKREKFTDGIEKSNVAATPMKSAAPEKKPAKVPGSTLPPPKIQEKARSNKAAVRTTFSSESSASESDESGSSSSESEDEDEPESSKSVEKNAALSAESSSDDSSSDSDSDSESDEADQPSIKENDKSVTKESASGNADSSDSDSSDSSDSDSSDESDSSDDDEPSQKPSAQPSTPGAKQTFGSVSSGVKHSVIQKIEDFVAAGCPDTLHLSASLNSYERLLAHDCAEKHGLQHVSVGEGLERHITIAKGSASSNTTTGKRKAQSNTTPGSKRAKSWSKNRK